MGGSTIWLVGLMGAGKSAVGRALAERRGRPLRRQRRRGRGRRGPVDRGDLRDGRGGGLPAPRARRHRSLAGRPGVVALGGGAIAQPGMAERLRASGRVVYLRARPETLARRVGEGEGRPLLAGLDAHGRVARLGELLAEREIHYGRADVTIDTDDLDGAAACAAVAAALGACEGEGR